MSSTLPVPSKGALRTLRNIVLGTSCTVAFSAGMLTEDRRRRIHAAREVHDNAKRLKSSRKYHGVGTASIEAFEEQAMRYSVDALMPAEGSKPLGTIDRIHDSGVGLMEVAAGSSMLSSSARSSKRLPHEKRTWRNLVSKTISKAVDIPTAPSKYRAPLMSKQNMHNRQLQLAFEVTKLLEDLTDLDAAALRFFNAFEEGCLVDGDGIKGPLVDAALKLSSAFRTQSNLEAATRVFEVITSCGDLDEEKFYLFEPEIIIRDLLSRRSSKHKEVAEASLKRAAAVFLTKFKEKPKTMRPSLEKLGDRLCAETCRSRLYDLTLELFMRLEICRGGRPPRAVQHLITATHRKGEHRKMFGYFEKFYAQTSPDQQQFYNVGSLVIDSVLRLDKEGQAEQALKVASQMAQDNQLLTSTTWFLKVLGNDWRAHRNITRTRAQFERLLPQLQYTQHPQAFYGAVIQFCVEVQDEATARSYYEKMRKIYRPSSDDIRIYGHFALAKAMRNDWEGVKEDLHKMKQLNPFAHDEFSASFSPILKRFVKSHSVDEIEDFVTDSINDSGLRLTPIIMNIMIESYAGRKEIDSIARWIEYSTAVGCPVDAVSFNTMLKHCFYTWKFTYGEIMNLYAAVRELDAKNTRLIDQDTVPILRQIAIAKCSDEEERRGRLKGLKPLDRPLRSLDSRGVYRAMAVTFAKGNALAALKIYRHAQKNKISVGSQHLLVAVKASLQHHKGNIRETTSLIRDAQMSGCNIHHSISAVFVKQIKDMNGNNDARSSRVDELARKTISTFEECGLQVPVTVVTHTASLLVSKGYCQPAIELLNSMSLRLGITSSEFDLVTLTVLLKAYIGLQDPGGVTWVVKMLSANNLTPDAHFRLLLKNTRREMTRRLQDPGCSDKMYRFLDAILDAIRCVHILRKDWVADKKAVKEKTIMIIGKAIEVQKAREAIRTSSPPKWNNRAANGYMAGNEGLDDTEAYVADGFGRHLHVQPHRGVEVVAG